MVFYHGPIVEGVDHFFPHVYSPLGKHTLHLVFRIVVVQVLERVVDHAGHNRFLQTRPPHPFVVYLDPFVFLVRNLDGLVLRVVRVKVLPPNQLRDRFLRDVLHQKMGENRSHMPGALAPVVVDVHVRIVTVVGQTIVTVTVGVVDVHVRIVTVVGQTIVTVGVVVVGVVVVGVVIRRRRDVACDTSLFFLQHLHFLFQFLDSLVILVFFARTLHMFVHIRVGRKALVAIFAPKRCAFGFILDSGGFNVDSGGFIFIAFGFILDSGGFNFIAFCVFFIAFLARTLPVQVSHKIAFYRRLVFSALETSVDFLRHYVYLNILRRIFISFIGLSLIVF